MTLPGTSCRDVTVANQRRKLKFCEVNLCAVPWVECLLLVHVFNFLWHTLFNTAATFSRRRWNVTEIAVRDSSVHITVQFDVSTEEGFQGNLYFGLFCTQNKDIRLCLVKSKNLIWSKRYQFCSFASRCLPCTFSKLVCYSLVLK